MKRSEPYLILLGALYVWEVSAICTLLALHRFALKPNTLAVFSSRLGMVFLIASASVLAASFVIIHQFCKIWCEWKQYSFLNTGDECRKRGPLPAAWRGNCSSALSPGTPAGLVVGKTLFVNFFLGDVDDQAQRLGTRRDRNHCCAQRG
jgi:hypothetical protein